MSLRKNIAKLLVPLLVPPRHGVWLEGMPKEDGIYIFLFGRSAESISLIFPPPRKQGPVPVFLTDNSTAEGRLIERGHIAVNLGAFRSLKEKLALSYALYLTQSLFAIYRPVRLLFTPEFNRELPRARSFVRRLLKYMMQPDQQPLEPRLGFLMPECSVEVRPTEQMIKNLGGEVGHDGMVHFFAFGSPLYFDYVLAFEQKPPADVVWLGWRSRFAPPAPADSSPDLNVMILDARLAATVIAGLEKLPNRNAWGNIRRVDLAKCSFEEALALPGLFISDGRSDLLPLLAARRPVTLLWNPRADRPTLLRVSYFLGNGRWPVFESVEELLAGLGRQPLKEFWAPYENRTCTVEEAAGSDLAAGIARFYEGTPAPPAS